MPRDNEMNLQVMVGAIAFILAHTAEGHVSKENDMNVQLIIGMMVLFLVYLILRLDPEHWDLQRVRVVLHAYAQEKMFEYASVGIIQKRPDFQFMHGVLFEDDLEVAEEPIKITPGKTFDAPTAPIPSGAYKDAIEAVGRINDFGLLWRKDLKISTVGDARIDVQKVPTDQFKYFNLQAQLNGRNLNGEKTSFAGVMIHQDLQYETNRQDEIIGCVQEAMIKSLENAKKNKVYQFQMVEYATPRHKEDKTKQSSKKPGN